MIGPSAGTYNPWPTLAVWVLVTIGVVFLRRRNLRFSAGLTFAFAVNMWVNHGAVGALFALPAYPAEGIPTSLTGLQVATLGLFSAALGAVFLAPLLLKRWQPPHKDHILPVPKPELERLYIGIGLASYLILLPLTGKIPTVTSLLAAGWRFLVVGLALATWSPWQRGEKVLCLSRLLIGLVSLPAMTIIASGFLSYGQAAAIAVSAFAIHFIRPRWPFLLIAPLAGFLGLSFFVTYMRDRPLLREIIWEEQEGLGNRVGQLSDTFSRFEWFDPNNEFHLSVIDDRLNQNFLVGAGVEYLSAGFQKFAHGDTLWQAALAVIPRVLWPDKPVTGGSGSLVSDYTGIEFEEGTSVGIGPVMEFYVNFGIGGVLWGFLCLGTAIGYTDYTVGRYLAEGDWRGFSTWYAAGLALIDVSGSLAEVVSSAAAGLVTGYFLHRYVVPRILHRTSESPSVRSG